MRSEIPKEDRPRFGWSATTGVSVSQCAFCVHKHRTGATCDAFPNGIPDDILANAHDHRESFIGDHGIRFEPLPGQQSPFEKGTE